MYKFFEYILKNFISIGKNFYNFCLFLLNLLKNYNLKLKNFLVDLDLKLSKKLISLIDAYIERQRDNLLNWYIFRYLVITREIPKFLPWLYRLVEVRIPLMIVDPRNDLTVFWIAWFFCWNLWYLICDAFLIHVDPFYFALYFVEYFVLTPPIAYYCALFSQIMMYVNARQIMFIRRHKLFFVTNRKRVTYFLRVYDVCFFCFFYYYMTNTMPGLYSIEITYMLNHYF